MEIQDQRTALLLQELVQEVSLRAGVPRAQLLLLTTRLLLAAQRMRRIVLTCSPGGHGAPVFRLKEGGEAWRGRGLRSRKGRSVSSSSVCFRRTWSSIRRFCWTQAATFHLSTTSSSGSEWFPWLLLVSLVPAGPVCVQAHRRFCILRAFTKMAATPANYGSSGVKPMG